MIEARADLWAYPGADAICVTTNGMVKGNGAAVMGAGVAKQLAALYPFAPYALGGHLARNGNHAGVFGDLNGTPLVAFPVKHHWKDQADIELIARSARELVDLTDREGWECVVLPRPGCGNGRLSWGVVYPVVDQLDDRFVVVTL